MPKTFSPCSSLRKNADRLLASCCLSSSEMTISSLELDWPVSNLCFSGGATTSINSPLVESKENWNAIAMLFLLPAATS
ncbi:hypothetical protein MPTK1_3g17520 [Marchantia polymorpha subsp. ruderalis]|uniref:Uncharacterized protein n=2 Tax=Marchantia polymorpha TaxID=3197 RepID=A0AAF6B1V5_MARPO|nr:hypothetical protein MARPO_0039s0042 [Marchantia polymorpha]BBN05989.1 hypothetical protein Mp_3g17520 [Marchantia polymorpha subsp. ruderalis]|eukprot:PTQ40535.1 hypothetical protein MARPO_0039s0042 [Marchantia polymorpha]